MMAQGAQVDGEPPPTEQDVLAQFLFSAIEDIAESDRFVELLLEDEDGRDFDHFVNEWVDSYAGRRS